MFLARDIRSTTGKNLRLLADITGLNPWTARYRKLKSALVKEDTVVVPETDRWRLQYFCKLVEEKREAHTKFLEQEDSKVEEIIHSLVVN